MTTFGKEIIRMEHVCKTFPGVRALDDMSIAVHEGEVHALIGENGAGKSTLIKILMGVYPMSSGSIFVEGEPVVIKNPIDAQALGLGAVYQDITIAYDLTVAENFFLGRIPKSRFGLVDWKKMERETQKVLDELNIKVRANSLVKNLSVAQQEMVLIAKKYFEHSKLLIFDEPTALLSNDEVKELFTIIRKLRKEGVACIYITHRLEELFELCDTVTVMKDGEFSAKFKISETNEKELISKMVGRTVEDMYSIEQTEVKEEVLRVENLTRKGTFQGINFSLHKGEIFGIFGLVGSGRSEIVRSIYGCDPYDSGKIYLSQEETIFKHPSDAIAKGVGLVPEDRKLQGLTLDNSVEHNINMASYGFISRLGVINLPKERERSQTQIESLRIKTPSGKQKVLNLSGGNQQKVVIGKWLTRNSKIFIFDEPTVGIDVGAKSEIYILLEKLLKEGNSIIMISSYLPEIMGIADRIMVIHEGKQMDILTRGSYSEEKLLALASGIR